MMRGKFATTKRRRRERRSELWCVTLNSKMRARQGEEGGLVGSKREKKAERYETKRNETKKNSTEVELDRWAVAGVKASRADG